MANQQTPDRVISEPVPVPPATDDVDRDRDADRDGYPDKERDAAEDVTDRVPGDALDDRGTFDDPVLAEERNDPDDLTAVSPGAPEYHEPAPQATAFGAATVGGAAAAAAQAGPSREVHDRTDVEGAVGDRDRDGAIDVDRDGDPDGTTDYDRDGTAAYDRDGTAAYDPDGTAAFDADRAAEERAYEDAADRAHADGQTPGDETLGGPSDLPETTPVVDTPAQTAAQEPIVGLWSEETAQGYRDRWREVQLRFVDDPPGAAREANTLVEEAVGALTAELSRQKEELSGWSGEDTEEMRAVVRRHRDFLDRLLGL